MAAELYGALADDLAGLIRLHDRELDRETVDALQAADFPACLALFPEHENSQGVWALLREAVRGLGGVSIDELAAEYAAIYLNHRYAASPYESVWLDDDHLTCQQPMFELREIYRQAGLAVAGERYDDHLVLQLQYLRHRFGQGEIQGLADFIDEHLGYWLPDFASRVASQAETAFYAGLALVSVEWLQALRHLLAGLEARPVPARQAMQERIERKLAKGRSEVAPVSFMPGAQGPGW